MDIQIQDVLTLDNSTGQSEDLSKVFSASEENEAAVSAPAADLNSPLDLSETLLLCSKTDKDWEQWRRRDLPVITDGVNAFQANDSSAARAAAETVPGPDVSDFAPGASRKSGDCCAASLLQTPLHPSNDSDGDSTAAPLSDLYIFEGDCDPQAFKCPQSQQFPQAVTEISFKINEERDSSDTVSKYDQELSEDQSVGRGSDEENSLSFRAPDMANAAIVSEMTRGDSPDELWLDARQYFGVEDSEERIVAQDSTSTITSDFFVLPGETQSSGCSQNSCDVIGWSFDDKSWGPPVERWSSVDSWASALSDWADIISSPAEDLTAAFTEIGAEIDALTQALAEVTTQIETELQSEEAVDVLGESSLGVQEEPLDITRSSVVMGQRRFEEEDSSEALDGRERGLDKTQSKSLSAVIASEMHRENTAVLSTAPRGVFEGVTDLLDLTFDSETDSSSEVILNIVEDTDWEYTRASMRLLHREPNGGHEQELKNEAGPSRLDLAAENSERTGGPEETLNVTCQRKEALGVPLRSPTSVHVPEANCKPGLNVHALPDGLGDFDGACQVEPLWGSADFLTPLSPLGIGSSLVTQASSSSSLNGDPEAAGWARYDSVYDPGQALDFSPESDEVTDFSSESSEDIAFPKQTDSDRSEDLNADEVPHCPFTQSKSIHEEGRDLLNLRVIPNEHFFVSEEKRVACFTLDLYDPFAPLFSQTVEKMPHKTHKPPSEGKTRSRKEKPAGQPHGAPTSRKAENLSHKVEAEVQPQTVQDKLTREQDKRLEYRESVIDTAVAPPKEMGRRHSKKKKKHSGKGTTESHPEPEPEVKADAARTETFKEKVVTEGTDQPDALKKISEKPDLSKDKASQNAVAPNDNDDIIKKRRLSQNKFGKLLSSLESKLSKGDTSKASEDKTDVGATRRKAYSEVVKQKSVKPPDPKVVKPIQAASVSGDPQSLCLWCQFSDVLTDHTVTWRKDRMALTETKRSAGDESRVSLTISNASHKDLGKYQCELNSDQKRITLDFLLTYELLSQIVLPTTPKANTSVSAEVDHEEESVHCSRLMFKEDFLAEQYFGESHSASIVTEKIHFGEGMHRRAFRTTLQAGQIPLLVTGHPCVLKVHNAISYGTKNSEELVQKNFNLAVEECQVQNTAREYIKAYTAVAESFEAFGSIPEIIPIYLVHRPSNDIPYATLEEELIGDFVKYSVKDGKEINLMRKDSEAGQKCCAFQHWVYHYTEGNLLVTDMQGVGMRLTDVGIATCKKGYKGFKGNCATTFIDQFKALHQCNSYCEILGLKSLQPKPKKAAAAPKAKAQPGATPKKKMFEPVMKGKS